MKEERRQLQAMPSRTFGTKLDGGVFFAIGRGSRNSGELVERVIGGSRLNSNVGLCTVLYGSSVQAAHPFLYFSIRSQNFTSRHEARACAVTRQTCEPTERQRHMVACVGLE